MELYHYSEEEFDLENMVYDQSRLNFQSKPVGLWVSVGDEWEIWCKEQEFALERLTCKYRVILKKEANILYLDTEDKIYDMHIKYPCNKGSLSKLLGFDDDTNEIDWLKVKSEYQGIIISPYQWECRLSMDSSWYYGWDCASGCIWDINCIDFFGKQIWKSH
jgi:hypothetical protein